MSNVELDCKSNNLVEVETRDGTIPDLDRHQHQVPRPNLSDIDQRPGTKNKTDEMIRSSDVPPFLGIVK